MFVILVTLADLEIATTKTLAVRLAPVSLAAGGLAKALHLVVIGERGAAVGADFQGQAAL